MVTIPMMQDASEIVRYDTHGIPLYIHKGQLSWFPKSRALAHWHEDLELVWSMEGTMFYYINGTQIQLKENDILLVNQRQMHYGFGKENQDCTFLCVLIRPELLIGNDVLYQTYVQPLLKDAHLPFWHFQPQMLHYPQMLQILKQVWELKEAQPIAYEMQVISLLQQFWVTLLQTNPPITAYKAETDELETQRDMITYIYHHYTDTIALEDIAVAGNVCRARCCSMFKKYLQQSPIDFLNHYRLEVSTHLLTTTKQPITEIALSCGFHHSSYYTKLFHRHYHCTPLQYRNRTKERRESDV